ncbi:DUF3558 family protein [Amycolatopsis sp. K13G38]|uniref:DUF3558 family protein n=1 Tax=Amycolatopsis acididurans TaxID=2724524 RepID=A0ABX1JGH3_9PSEU|nr:DUF3558 family protein [Amycolatopsis acididurans]NKQ57520.1 DUF3558 family protein [Amycolatopsis acididurans]
MRSLPLVVGGSIAVLLAATACGGSGGEASTAAPSTSAAASWQAVDVCSLVTDADTAQLFPGKPVEHKESSDAQKRECAWNPQGLIYENIDVRVWQPLSKQAITGTAKRTMTVAGHQVYVARETSSRCELNVDMSTYLLGITRQSYSDVTCDALQPLAGTIIERAGK